MKGLIYFGIIVLFVLGAIAGNSMIDLFGQKAIWCSSLLMLVSNIMMFVPGYEKD